MDKLFWEIKFILLVLFRLLLPSVGVQTKGAHDNTVKELILAVIVMITFLLAIGFTFGFIIARII